MFNYMVNEIKRELKELLRFKVNLIFANMSLFVMFYGLTEYIYCANKNILFFTLFCWYLSSNAISYPTYVLEDEIIDGTLITINQSNKSIQHVLVIRCLNKFIIDLFKGIPVFVLFYIVGNYDFNIMEIFISFWIVVLTVLIVYGIGITISSFIFYTARLSAFISMIGYLLLFFTTLTLNSPLFKLEKFIFPFYWMRNSIIQILQRGPFLTNILFLIIQLIIISFLSNMIFKGNVYFSKKRGGIDNL